MEKLAKTFKRCKLCNEGVLVTYFTIGDPAPRISVSVAKALVKAGADILEIGIPPPEAKYDGPIIKTSYRRAKTLCTDVKSSLNWIKAVNHETPDASKIILAYYEVVRSLGLQEFLKLSKKAGADGILCPDLTIDFLEEMNEFGEACVQNDLSPIYFVTSSTPDHLTAKAVELGRGFLYFGLRFATGIPLPICLKENLQKILTFTMGHIPLIVGFGLKGYADVEKVMTLGADGVVLGSVLVKVIEKNINHQDEMLKEITRLTSKLKNAVNKGYRLRTSSE